jgi:hypothetical protein
MAGDSSQNARSGFDAGVPPCYRALEIDTLRATREEIRRAYRRLSKRMHPDAGGSAEAFRSLRENYERALERCASARNAPGQRNFAPGDEWDTLLKEVLRDRSGQPDPFFCAGAWDPSPSQRRRNTLLYVLVLVGFCLLLVASIVLHVAGGD